MVNLEDSLAVSIPRRRIFLQHQIHIHQNPNQPKVFLFPMSIVDISLKNIFILIKLIFLQEKWRE